MITFDKSMDSLIKDSCHRFATCWEVERTDDTILRLTDHNAEIMVGIEVYSPAGGFSASAFQKQSGLKPGNVEIIGLLNSDYITHSDLKTGKYREAKVTEMLVDWRYPWAGTFLTNVYWITDIRFSGEHWEAQLEGLSRNLKTKVGNIYSRGCGHILGDSNCGVTLASYKESDTVSSVVTQRLKFRGTTLLADDGDYDGGYLVWTRIGDLKKDLKSEIKTFTTGNDEIELQLKTPFDIDAADTFDIYEGCDKLAGTCKDKFSNLDNFGGFPFIPGTDSMKQQTKVKGS
jgi:uncharacterized phage protein (TIGR02218 family)